jgi:N-methylhydantoinase B
VARSDTGAGAAPSLTASERDHDPVMLTLIQGALSNIQQEMTATLQRSGRSNVCTIARDYSNAIFDGRNEMVLQGQDIPVHLGSLIFGLKGVAKAFESKLEPGDVIYHNDPTFGGSHIADMCAYKPVFVDGELRFWAVSKLHVVDAGGPVAGSYNMGATEIWGEGLRIPPVKIVQAGVVNDDLLKLILLNLRTSENQAGDIRAQLGAVGVAERRLLALCDKYGANEVRSATEALKALADRQMRAVIAAAPDGVGVGSTLVEDTGHGLGHLEITVTATVEGEHLRIELSSPPQVPHFINSYESNTVSSVYLGLLMWAQLPPPYNEGLYRSVSVDCGPSGTITNAVVPAPCMLSTSIPCENIAYATQKALTNLKRHRTIGEWGRTYAAHAAGIDPRNGQYFVNNVLATEISGAGATFGVADGWHVIGPGNVLGAITSGDTEIIEFLYPMIIREYSIRQDSGGAGKWRGGCGSRYAIESLGDMHVSSFGQGLTWPSEGVEGARDVLVEAKIAGAHVKNADGSIEPQTTNTMFTLKPGQLYVTDNPGGGGAGDPLERAIADVARDVRARRVSVKGAAVEYGVVVVPETLEVDESGTTALRERIRAERSTDGEEAR